MLAIILPVHNRSAVTARFLDCLIRQEFQGYELILVDDGCTDETVAVAKSKIGADRLTILSGDGNLWWAGALQLAYEHLVRRGVTADDTVLIVNDDVTFAPDFLASGLAVLGLDRRACVQAMGVDRSTSVVDRGAIADLVQLGFRAARSGEQPNCLSTRGLLMSASTFLASGGFRPRWLPHYLSDYEFTLRLRRSGAPLRVAEAFSLEAAFEMTGMNAPASNGVRQLWLESFSNRAKFNPKHWSAFVLLACPFWVVPLHLARIWLGFGRSLAKAAWPRAQRASR